MYVSIATQSDHNDARIQIYSIDSSFRALKFALTLNVRRQIRGAGAGPATPEDETNSIRPIRQGEHTMRKFTLITVAAALAASTGAASAADLGGYKDEPMAMPAPMSSWTGIYIGGGIGVGAANHKLNVSAFDEVITSNVDGFGGQGVFGTIQGGVDYQIPGARVVIGGFVDYDWSNVSTEANLNVLGTNVAHAELDVDDQWTIGGRLGFLTSPDTLIYGLAGYTEMDATGSYSLYGGLGGSKEYSFSGWSVGAGMETRLTGNLFLKGEYRFSQFDKETLFNVNGVYADRRVELLKGTLEPDLHTVRAVLSYKFNGNHAAPLK
jgi:outer membrane immunogenic protein